MTSATSPSTRFPNESHATQVLNGVGRLLPFPVSEAEEGDAPREELRLKNRVLDLRCVLLGGPEAPGVLAVLALVEVCFGWCLSRGSFGMGSCGNLTLL